MCFRNLTIVTCFIRDEAREKQEAKTELNFKLFIFFLKTIYVQRNSSWILNFNTTLFKYFRLISMILKNLLSANSLVVVFYSNEFKRSHPCQVASQLDVTVRRHTRTDQPFFSRSSHTLPNRSLFWIIPGNFRDARMTVARRGGPCKRTTSVAIASAFRLAPSRSHKREPSITVRSVKHVAAVVRLLT